MLVGVGAQKKGRQVFTYTRPKPKMSKYEVSASLIIFLSLYEGDMVFLSFKTNNFICHFSKYKIIAKKSI